jgi:superfamily II DNA or RNA helicase
LKPRPYQTDAMDQIIQQFTEVQSTLLVLPTGTGKTIVFSMLADMAKRGRVMVIAHREELIDQAARKITAITGSQPDIEMADRSVDTLSFHQSKIVVASVQTLIAGMGGKGRMTKFSPDEFSLIIFDEAHHIGSPSWGRVMEWFKKNTSTKFLGVTATPNRHDKLALREWFETVAYEYTIEESIEDGWLVPIRQQVVEIEDLDYSAIRTTGGDLNTKDLANVMEKEHHLHSIATPTLEVADGRKTLVFVPSVKCAERLCEIFNRHLDCARWICGKTPKQERRDLIAGYASGEFQIMVNVGCLTEGFDEPGVELIVMARPTKSTPLWMQMVGRGTRPLPGVVDDGVDSPDSRKTAIASSPKPYLEILDFAGNAGRHKLLSVFDVLGGRYPQDVRERAMKNAARTAASPQDIEEALEEASEELLKEREEERQREAAKRARLRAKVTYNTQKIDPFDALDIVPIVNEFGNVNPPTDKMLDLLAKQGIDGSSMSHAAARQLCGTIVQRFRSGLCTVKQANLLSKYGYGSDYTRDQAGQIIDKIKSNGWRRPA